MERKKLREARERKRWTQEYLAELMGTRQQTISDWERAQVIPYLRNQRKLARFLEVDADELMEITYENEAIVSPSKTLPAEALPQSDQNDLPPEKPIVVPVPDTIQRFIDSNLERRLYHIAHTNYPSPDQMTSTLRQAIEEFDGMNDPIARREAIWSLTVLPMTLLGEDATLHTRQYDEMLRYCIAALEGCRRLCCSRDPPSIKHAFNCATTYTSLLERIARNSITHHEQALNLAIDYALLYTLLGWKYADSYEAVVYAQTALALGKETGNLLLLLRAYSSLNLSYVRSGQYTRAWEIIQECEALLESWDKQAPISQTSLATLRATIARHKVKMEGLLVR